MKRPRLTDLNRPFDGMEEEISMTALREALGDVLLHVELGKTYVIVKNGKRVARLSPLEPTALELGAAVRRLGLTE